MNDDNKASEDYRRVLATANKLETIQSNLESVIDFFLAPIVKLYTKLCNDCMKLLFEGHFRLDQFRKAEELVWRRIYHDLYRFQKTKRFLIKRQDECLIESHFIAGIGFYSSLIVKLRSHFKIKDVHGLVAPLNLILGPIDNFNANERLNADHYDEPAAANDDKDSLCLYGDLESADQSKAKEWARQAVYRSLVYMGDLARYLLEVSQFDYRNLAFEFYRSASRNQPDYGLPFNQLATLAGGLNHNLDAVCNYMRCCLRPKPFEGAEGNMRKIFELNRRHHEELKNTGHITKISEVYSSKDPSLASESMVRAVIINFIRLTSDLWSAISTGKIDTSGRDQIIIATTVFFELIREAMELGPIMPLATSANFEQEFCPISSGSNYTLKPKYLSPTIIYEFCSVSIMLIAKYQKVQASNDTSLEPVSGYVVDLVNTLALNLLHYSTAKCHKMIISKVQELRVIHQELTGGIGTTYGNNIGESISSKPSSETNLRDYHGVSSFGGSRKSVENLNFTSDLAARRAQSRLRQKKAATNYSDSNQNARSLLAPSEDLDLTELEETALSTIDALDISSDMSEETANDLIDLGSSSDDELSDVMNQNNLSKPRFLRPTRSQNYEVERSTGFMGSSCSLPMPDLLTGDMINDTSLAKVSSQSPLESLSESEMREKSTTECYHGSSSNMTELESAMVFIYTQTYLPTIKIFCDWLLANGSMIATNALSFVNFCKELQDMMSMLQELRRLAGAKDKLSGESERMSPNSTRCCSPDKSVIYTHLFDGPQWVQKYPLSCDFPLFCLDPLKSVHEINIDFHYSRDLTDSEAGFLTIECISAFTHALAAFLENKTSQ